jgi:hypothetical protein
VSEDQYTTEMELYGVSPGVIAFIMIFVTASVPLGFFPEMMVYSVLWVIPLGYIIFLSPYGFFPFYFIDPFAIFVTLPFTILNVVFAVWVVRYYKAKTSRDTVVLIGMLSLLLPPALVIYLTAMTGTILFLYPIPIQFIVGLIIMWRIEGPEVISPWSGMRLDLSWWKWGRPKRRDDWDPFENEKKTAEKEDWLEE